MNNFIATPRVFAKLVLMALGGELNVCKTMNHDVSQEFGKKANKIGATVQIRRPYRFIPSDRLVYDPQPLVDTWMPATVSRIAQVGYDWDSVEKTLSIREMDELYAKPAALALASKINAAAATFCADNIFNSVGTPGTAPNSVDTYLAAGDLVVAQGLPENEDLNLIVNRRMSSAFVSGNKALFNPTGAISKMWQQGDMVDSMGYKVYRDQTINLHTVGTYGGTPLVNGANQVADGGNNGTMTLVTDGWASSALNQGDVFTLGSATDPIVGGVQSVHPQTRIATGYLQQFTQVDTISDIAGAMSPVIYPAITPSGQYQNVDSSPADNAIITVVGASGAVSRQGLLMHKQGFAFISVPLSGPAEGEGAVVFNERDPETGIAIRMFKAFDYINSRHINAFHVLYDFAKLYPEMCCKIQS